MTQPKPSRRVQTPTLLQMEAAECGAASLGIILGYYRLFVPLEELRVSCGVSRDGSKAGNLILAGRQYNLEAKGFRYNLEQVKSTETPFVVFWNFNHFLVVEGFTAQGVYLNDPAKGPRRVTEEEFSNAYTGVTLVLRPGPEFKPGGAPPNLLASLSRRGRGSQSALVFVILISLVLVIPGVVLPGLTRIFVDECLTRGRQEWVGPVLAGLALTGLSRALLIWMQQAYLLRLETRLALQSSASFFWHVLRLPMDFFAQRFGGEIGFRVGLNDRVAQLLSGQLATAALNALMVSFFGLLMLLVDLRLALIAIGLGACNVLALRQVARTRKDANERLQAERGLVIGTAMGGLQMIETLKASGGEDDLFSRWAGYQANLVETQQQLSITAQYLSAVPPFLRMLSSAAILSIGGLEVMSGTLSVGALVAFQTLAASFSQPIDLLVDQSAVWQEASGDMRRLDDVLHAKPLDRLESGAPAAGQLRGSLALRDVSFGYSRLEPPLIEKFSCQLQPGSRVAIVGDTGSGKSTVARLVCGLLEPWEGEVLLDGQPLPALSPALVTQSVSLVDESIFMFAGSVRDNLTLWNPRVSDEQLTAAARDACILDEILSRPGGFDSPVAEAGANFSGGQRQRLEIARALVMNPTLLILDEATSALDPQVEASVDANLRRRGCTCLIVAHRLSTIRDCEEIVVLEGGKVVQRGIHQDLVSVPGAYARLVDSGSEDQSEPPELADSTDGESAPAAQFTQSTMVRRLASVGGLRDRLARDLEPLPGGANRPVLVNDDHASYLLKGGGADLFFSDPATGRRHFLYALPGNSLVVGLPTAEEPGSLLLVGQVDTQTYELERERVSTVGANPTYRPALAVLIENWAVSLFSCLHQLSEASGARREQEVTTFQILRPGTHRLEALAAGRIVQPVLWLRVESGRLRLWADELLELAEGATVIPLSSNCWMQAVSDCSLSILDSAEALACDPDPLVGGVWLNGRLRSLATRRSSREQEDALGRLQHRVEIDLRMYQAAHLELATIMSGRSMTALADDAGLDLTFAVCQTLERALGVRLRKPPAGGEELTDPVFGVREVARVSNLRVREVALVGTWWKRACQPMVVFFDKEQGRPGGVTSDGRGCWLHSPGASVRVDAALAGRLAGTALAFYLPLPMRPLTGLDVLRFGLNEARADVARILLTGLAVGALALALPLFTERVFSTVVPGGERTELLEISLALLITAVSTALFQTAGNVALLRLETKVDSSLQAAVWDRMLRLPASFFRQFTAGELSMRAMGISMMVQMLVGSPLRGLLGGLFSACSFAVLFWVDARMALLVLLLAVAALAFTLFCGISMLHFQRRIAEAQGQLSGLVLQLITGLSRLRVAGAESRAFYLWSQGFTAQRRLQFRARSVSNALMTFQGSYPILATFLLFWFYTTFERGELQTAGFLAFFAAFGQVFAGLGEMAASLVPMLAALPNYERTLPILTASPEVSDRGVNPGALRGEVSLSHVSFRYQPEGALVLDDVSIQVSPGEFVAIVGPSGAGKSSLCRLLLGFETPTTGSVSFDGQDLANLDVSAVRHEIGVVLQNSQLARGPLLNTIIGSSALTSEDAWEAARLAGIDEDIRRMPMEMMTYVGEGAATFSGGQKQRLLIARAIARRPRILLLDEATSGLDNRSQLIVSESLQRLRASRIVIAHRLSTVVGADRIYVMQAGKVVQMGKYADLIAQEGTFRQLALRQLT